MTVARMRQEFKLCSPGPDDSVDSADECSDACGSESAASSENVVAPDVEVIDMNGVFLESPKTRRFEGSRNTGFSPDAKVCGSVSAALSKNAVAIIAGLIEGVEVSGGPSLLILLLLLRPTHAAL